MKETPTNEIFIIKEIKPTYNLVLCNQQGEVGRLDWGDGTLRFVGTADEAARTLFDFLKPFIDEYIQLRIKEIE